MRTDVGRRWACVAALALTACATSFDNAPLTGPLTAPLAPALAPAAMAPHSTPPPLEPDGGAHLMALSLSGGGMRAAAFAFGVLQALQGSGPAGVDVFDDLTFISSVSGGSLTAAYFGLHGRDGFSDFRSRVLDQDFEREMRMSMWSPVNITRLLAGGLNDRSNLAHTLHREVFGQATFAQLHQRNKPEVWINASDLYNRTPFPFIAPVFMGLCSDLSKFHVADAVAASMAVPLVFAPIVLQTYPDRCLTSLPAWALPATSGQADRAGQAGQGVVGAVAQALRNYRNAKRMRYVKLVDGGITDNNGLSSILIARAVSGTPYGPLEEGQAVRARRILFLVVDAGRPPAGEWAKTQDGPSGVEVALAAADTAVDSATRLGADAFARMVEEWRASIIRFRCSLSLEQLRRHLAKEQQDWLSAGAPWRCDDLQFEVSVIGFENLAGARAERLKNMPTRLVLPKADIDEAIAAGRDATRDSPAMRRYLNGRIR